MSMRIVKSARRTDETEISLTLNLDGSGIYDVDTGCGFLNHMLELFSRHGRFDLTLACRSRDRLALVLARRNDPG